MIIILIVLVAIVLILVIGSYFGYRYAMVRNDKIQSHSAWENPPAPRSTTEWDYFGKYDEVCAADQKIYAWQKEHGRKYTIQSYDGLKLSARYLPPMAGELKAIILTVHGFRGDPIFCFTISAVDYLSQGFGYLMIDQRSHCESEGNVICYGVRERYDVRDWAKMLQTEFPDVPVILDGVSMGAGTVMAAAGLDLPSNVKGIIADCGYTSMYGIFAAVAKERFHLPSFPIVPLIGCWCRLFNGFGISDVDSRETLSHAKVPVFLAHGREDDFVPFYMGEQIYEANKDRIDVTFFISEKAKHGTSYFADYDAYRAELAKFFAKILK